MNGSNLLRTLVVFALTASTALAQETPVEETPAEAPTEAPASVDEERQQTSPPPSYEERRETTSSARTTPVADSTSGIPDKRETFGAVMAPAALPSGAQAAYVYLGVQDLGAGYRQGIGLFELEGRARFNYLLVSLAVDGIAKFAAYRDSLIELAPYLGVGFTFDTGARYFDSANFSHVGFNLIGGATFTYRFTETLRGIANVEIPYDLSFSPSGAGIFKPLAGVGAEIYLGNDISALALGSLGYVSIKEPLAVPATRVGYQFRLGLGYRFF